MWGLIEVIDFTYFSAFSKIGDSRHFLTSGSCRCGRFNVLELLVFNICFLHWGKDKRGNYLAGDYFPAGAPPPRSSPKSRPPADPEHMISYRKYDRSEGFPERDIWSLHVMDQGSCQIGRVLGTSSPSPPPPSPGSSG